MPDATATRIKGPVAVLVVCMATLVAFLVIEGVSSCLLVFSDLFFDSQRPLAERVHCRYDETLGWVQIPNLDIRNMYGPGIFLRTNKQGFRGNQDFAAAVPDGATRIICSGDSFTLGYGVDDEHTWCQSLAKLGRHLETVNMGQGGYGVDQAYLWYMRDGKSLQHQVHLFAFNTWDFQRTAYDTFYGYGRPVLRIRDGRLAITNVPVPRRAYYLPWLSQNAHILLRLRSLKIIERVLRKIHPQPFPPAVPTEEIREVAANIFATLLQVNRGKGSTLVLVYLPLDQDYDRGDSDAWRDWVRMEAARQSIPFIDLVQELRKLPRDEAHSLFNGHFSIEGNQRIAQLIYAQVRSIPGLAARLAAAK